jgi:hypothetical protein
MKVLPKFPSKIDEFSLSDYFGKGMATEFINSIITIGNGSVVESLVIDRLIRKKYDLWKNPEKGGFFDCTINDSLVEIRRVNINTKKSKKTGKKTTRFYLYMGNTSRGTNTYTSRAEKVSKMISGGYILTRIINNGNKLLMYWFPTLSLINEYKDDCYSSAGINITRLNESFKLNIPLIG